MEMMHSLLDLADSIEDGIGPLITCYCIARLPKHSRELKQLLVGQRDAVHVLVHTGAYILFLLSAAEANASVSEQRAWIRLERLV